MRSRATRKDLALILGVFLMMLGVGFAAWKMSGPAAIIPIAVTCLAIALWSQFEGVRRTSEQLEKMRRDAFDDYRQVESLLSLHAILKPDFALPPLRDHSASPDLLNYTITRMMASKPNVVVELGSGASTVILAQCLKRIGAGRLISIDHDAAFAERTTRMLAERGLSDVATVVHLPLERIELGGSEYLWYSIDRFDAGGEIDFLFIDGPPYHVHPLARYPAIPLMLPRLSAGATIVMDDANRPEELRIREMWEREFSQLSVERLETEKGTLVIRGVHPAGKQNYAT